MKQFLKFTLATIVGILISGLLLFLILLAVAGAISSSDKQFELQENSVLKLSLDGEILEQGQDNPFDFAIPGLPVNTEKCQQGLDDILAAIKKAKTSDEIKGIYLEAGTINAGFATVEEIRDALIDFKKSGKYIIAYGDMYDQREYFVSSAADKIFINPSGMLNWCGLAATPVYFTKALEKLGVKVEIFKVGTFKSAVEPYTNTQMSPENRLQTSEYLNGIWNHLVREIATSRSMTAEELNRLADQNLLFSQASELLTVKMIDSLLYESEVKDYLAALNGLDKRSDLKMVSVNELLLVPKKNQQYIKDKIAVLYAEGDITDEGSEGIISDKMLEEIEKIRENDHIKAVVLRVNSPGGSAYASEQIWKALKDLKATKPIVVSMGTYAASGGYYISCNASKIIASPNTLTGSIGIFGVFPNFDKLTDKIGLDFDVVKTNELSDLGNITRPMTAIEKQKIQRYIENGYELFVKRCAEGRNIKPEKLKSIAEGRVWTGAKAVELGLADETGGIERAIEVAAELGKIKDYGMVYYPEKKDFMTELMHELMQQTKIKIALAFLGDEYSPFVKLKQANIETGVLARMDNIDIR